MQFYHFLIIWVWLAQDPTSTSLVALSIWSILLFRGLCFCFHQYASSIRIKFLNRACRSIFSFFPHLLGICSCTFKVSSFWTQLCVLFWPACSDHQTVFSTQVHNNWKWVLLSFQRVILSLLFSGLFWDPFWEVQLWRYEGTVEDQFSKF